MRIFPPEVQKLVDCLVRALLPREVRPIELRIDLDESGVVQRIEPRLRFKPEPATVGAGTCVGCGGVMVTAASGRRSCLRCGGTADPA